MSKFNTKSTNTTYEGAPAQRVSTEQAWVNALCSSLLGGGFYESEEEQESSYIKLTRQMIDARGPQFAAKAAVFSRNVLGMRSASALTAAILNEYPFEGKRGFYSEYFHRPDDVAEVFGAVDMLGGKRSHALVRGASDYLSGLSDYSLGKYKLSRREYNMYDLINLTHAHSDSIDKYKNGTLPVPETWETAISAARPEEKSDVWVSLVEGRKLGYMALLRNLRNLLTYVIKPVSWWEKYVFSVLTDKDAIERSLVFPYRIYVAYREIEDLSYIGRDELAEVVKQRLAEAFVTAIGNVPELKGTNLFVMDVSGSMSWTLSPKSEITLSEVGACYIAMLMLGNKNADFVKFGNTAKKIAVEDFSDMNIFDAIKRMALNDWCGNGTNLSSVWPLILGNQYDRIFAISDMQVMGAACDNYFGNEGNRYMHYKTYLNSVRNSPKVYTFNLSTYNHAPSDIANNSDIKHFTSLSEKTLMFISLLEKGVSVCDYIESGDWK